jgi:hypothetical protein
LNFIALIALIVYIEINKRLKGEFTVEGALLEMTNLMCLMRKIFNNETIVCEPTKEMKHIAEPLNYVVPKKSGV